MRFLNELFGYVLYASSKYRIDESHAVGHSMNVLQNANNIYKSELPNNPLLGKQENIIYASAILHDMCDKKYVDEETGLDEIKSFLKNYLSMKDIGTCNNIIKNMSYSTVKLNGFPSMDEYQHAYHIVREADLLAAYDFDRCMIYGMMKKNTNLDDSFHDATELFNNRVFKHMEDGLLTTEYSRQQHLILSNIARLRIDSWKDILNK
jgi:HD superfamily phosphodiesterase